MSSIATFVHSLANENWGEGGVYNCFFCFERRGGVNNILIKKKIAYLTKMSMYLVSGTSIQTLKKMLIKSKQENKRKPHKLLYYQYSPPPLFAASISAV